MERGRLDPRLRLVQHARTKEKVVLLRVDHAAEVPSPLWRRGIPVNKSIENHEWTNSIRWASTLFLYCFTASS